MLRTLALLVLLLWSLTSIAQTPTLPAFDRQVVDQVGLLSAGEAEEISQQIYELHAQGGPQMAIFIPESLQDFPIEEFSIRVAEKWQLGEKGKGNGLLVVIAPKERQMRIEVGQGIEGEITDYDANLWIRNLLTPAFKQQQYAPALAELTHRVGEKFGIKLAGKRMIQRARRSGGQLSPMLLLILIILFYLFRGMFGGGPPSGFGRRGGYYGGYGGGGFGGGGFGGGGWSGGGGGFSGGGSSGSW